MKRENWIGVRRRSFVDRGLTETPVSPTPVQQSVAPTPVAPRETIDDIIADKERIPCVTYQATPCPKCHGRSSKIYKTKKPVRWHQCRGCGLRFKSFDRDSASRRGNGHAVAS